MASDTISSELKALENLDFNTTIHKLKFKLNPNDKGLDKDIFHKLNENRPWMDRGLVCQAPFKSLRFEQNGSMRVCCFNSAVSLGTYPETSVQDAWFGKEADEIRTFISNNDFSLGCQLCGEQFNNGEIDTIKTRQFDGLPINPEKLPTVLDFSLNNLCNLECTMCTGQFSSLIRANREGLPPIKMQFDSEFVDQLEPFIEAAKQFIFAGGEPFLIPIYYDILNRIAEQKPNTEIHIVTNGTVLNNRVRELLDKLRFNITISIDSFDKDTYESIRKNASFKHTMNNLIEFEKYCQQQNTQFNFNVCPIKQNWREIPTMLKSCNELGRKMTLLTVVYPPTASLMSCSVEELSEINAFFTRAVFNSPDDDSISTYNLAQFEDLKRKVANWLQKSADKTGTRKDSVNQDKTVDVAIYLRQAEQKLKFFFEDNPELDTKELDSALDNLKYLEQQFIERKIKPSKLMELQASDPGQIFGGFRMTDRARLASTFRDHVL